MADKVLRQKKDEQNPTIRATNFDEVSYNYTEEQAILESSRCIQCKKPLCVAGCPVNVKIPQFILAIKNKEYLKAYDILKEDNYLPAVCGRVCPQESQCEGECVLRKKGDPVAIGNLERFAADYAAERNYSKPIEKVEKRNKSVAVVGSGPAGLTCAAELGSRGYDVTVFEALHEFGGVLVYGIPEFRLPKAIVKREIEFLKSLGVRFEKNQLIGRIKNIDELLGRYGFSAVFVATGAGFPVFMNIPGEDLNGVYSANEYLTRINLMRAYNEEISDTPVLKGKSVSVIGGGNVAMDAARSAKRMGAEHVYIIYRRTLAEMPARVEEIHHAEEEGIEFNLLCNPLKYIGDDKGFVKKTLLQKMELGEPDASGRRRPVPVSGSEYEIDNDVVIVAIGTNANPIIKDTTPGLETNKWGYIVTDENGVTSKKNVYAGGDIVSGAATVILAMGAGKKAARAIESLLG